MLHDEIRPSSEIDAYCTKCRMITNHRVVAMVDGVVKRVVCLTCDGQHNFRPPPGQKKETGSRSKRIQKERKKVREAGTAQTFQQWIELKEQLQDPPRPYNMNDHFEKGEAVAHARFGLGFVINVLGPKKIEIMFDTEIKTLVMNYSA